LALLRITEAILNNENSILPVSSLIEGYFGIKDVYLSLLAVVNRGGVREILNIEFSSAEKRAFINSAQTLKTIIKKLKL